VNELKERNDSTANDSTILAYYQQALRLSSPDDEYALGWLLGNIGRSYNRLHQPDSGLTFLRRAQTKLAGVPLETLEVHTLVAVYNAIAESYIQKADFTKALQILEKAEGLNKVIIGPSRKEFLDTYQLFQDIYRVQKKPAPVRYYREIYELIRAQLANIETQARIVQLERQVQVKNQEKHLLEMRRLELEGIDRFAKTILIPVSLLLFLSLIFIVWRQVKQDRRIRKYQIMIMACLPHFDFDERRKEKNKNKEEDEDE
jgi:tetratricopeptide (TPR) repeat protein